jgi:phosphatidate cytidylyltransferase
VGLLKREATAAVGIALVAGVLFFLPPVYFQALAGVVVLLTSMEVAFLYRARTNVLLVVLTPILAAVWACLPLFLLNPFWVIALGFFLPALAVLIRPDPLDGGSQRLFYAVAVPFMIGLPGGALMALRTALSREAGLKLIVFVLAVVWISDSLAYYIGKNLGKHKIAPQVSPKKTVEGTLALLAGSVVVTLAFFGPSAMNALMGLALGGACFCGDLIQSAAKRDLGVKDSGTFFPGHGGLWDRTDSLWWVSLAVFLWKAL